MTIPWEIVYDLPFQQMPDLEIMGVIGDPADPSWEYAEQLVRDYSADLGIGLEIVPAVSAMDAGLAAEQLMNAGVDWIFLPPRTSPTPGIPAIIQAAHEVTVFSAIATDVFEGVTIAGGFEGWYNEGVNAARLAIGVMRDEIDLASTGIASTPSYVLAVNMHSAELQGVEISQALLDKSKYVIGAEQDPAEVFASMVLAEIGPDMSLEERIAADRAFYDSLQCSPEMIAEQQAALE